MLSSIGDISSNAPLYPAKWSSDPLICESLVGGIIVTLNHSIYLRSDENINNPESIKEVKYY
jgi:hypothetical protein